MAAAEDKLVIVWSSSDRDVALNMVFMYVLNATRNGWWAEVELIVWGPSAKLLCEDMDLQHHVQEMMKAGVAFRACIACANNYGLADTLAAMGIDVRGMGVPLTEHLKAGTRVLTF